MTRPQSLVLTGPTGWIGTAILATAAAAWGPGWNDRVTLFGSSERRLIAPDGVDLPIRPLSQINGADLEGAHIVHLAYLTKEKVAALGAQGFFAANMAIDDALLDAMAVASPRGLFVASSGAAQSAQSGEGRELYGLCKLMQEDRFLAFGAARGVPVLAGRIFNLAGPFMNKLGSYAVSAFLQQAFATGAAHIQARTPVYRSYLHVNDLAALVLGSLDQGLGRGVPVDLCGGEVVEMEDVAREALRAAGAPDGRIVRGEVDFGRPSSYLGDPTSARTLALRLGLRLRRFSEQVDDTAADLRGRGAAG